MDEESIKAAEGLGMTAVQVKDITEALKEIQKLTEIEVRNSDPEPCNSIDKINGKRLQKYYSKNCSLVNSRFPLLYIINVIQV